MSVYKEWFMERRYSEEYRLFYCFGNRKGLLGKKKGM